MKRILLLVLLFLSVARPSIAAPINGLIALGLGTLSSDDNVAVAVNLNAGQRISVLGVGLDFSSTEGFCAVARAGASGLLITASSKRLTSITAPASDLYLYLCVKRAGLSGDFAPIILDGVAIPGATESEHDADLEALLEEAINRRLGR
jgi:hypothetical protein